MTQLSLYISGKIRYSILLVRDMECGEKHLVSIFQTSVEGYFPIIHCSYECINTQMNLEFKTYKRSG